MKKSQFPQLLTKLSLFVSTLKSSENRKVELLYTRQKCLFKYAYKLKILIINQMVFNLYFYDLYVLVIDLINLSNNFFYVYTRYETSQTDQRTPDKIRSKSSLELLAQVRLKHIIFEEVCLKFGYI